MPDEPQPTQKMFDSLVWKELKAFDVSRPVFVEGESKKIGRIRVPEALIEAMWKSPCIVLDAAITVRAELLKAEYSHYIAEPEALSAQLECLTALHGKETIERWRALVRAADADGLVEELLLRHYDPAYTRSTLKHYPALEHAPRYTLTDTSSGAFSHLAATVLETVKTRGA
jgi:tRNA 2-selenouridine synthase